MAPASPRYTPDPVYASRCPHSLNTSSIDRNPAFSMTKHFIVSVLTPSDVRLENEFEDYNDFRSETERGRPIRARLATAIRRVAERRDQQRDMVMRVRISDPEADRNVVEERGSVIADPVTRILIRTDFKDEFV